jgi:hypothetical protein
VQVCLSNLFLPEEMPEMIAEQNGRGFGSTHGQTGRFLAGELRPGRDSGASFGTRSDETGLARTGLSGFALMRRKVSLQRLLRPGKVGSKSAVSHPRTANPAA